MLKLHWRPSIRCTIEHDLIWKQIKMNSTLRDSQVYQILSLCHPLKHETTNSSSKHSPQLTQEYVSYYRGKAGVRASNLHSIMLHTVKYKLPAKWLAADTWIAESTNNPTCFVWCIHKTSSYIQGVPRVKVTTSGECSLC